MALGGTALLAAVAAQGTVAVRLGLGEMTGLAQRVVVGTVTDQWSETDPQSGLIFTYSVLRVSESLKGKREAELTVREVGGTDGDYAQQLVGGPRYGVGQEVVTFLEPTEDGSPFLMTVGLSQGLFRVAADPSTGRKLASPTLDDLVLAGPGVGAAEAGPRDLETFVDEIRGTVAAARRGGGR